MLGASALGFFLRPPSPPIVASTDSSRSHHEQDDSVESLELNLLLASHAVEKKASQASLGPIIDLLKVFSTRRIQPTPITVLSLLMLANKKLKKLSEYNLARPIFATLAFEYWKGLRGDMGERGTAFRETESIVLRELTGLIDFDWMHGIDLVESLSLSLVEYVMKDHDIYGRNDCLERLVDVAVRRRRYDVYAALLNETSLLDSETKVRLGCRALEAIAETELRSEREWPLLAARLLVRQLQECPRRIGIAPHLCNTPRLDDHHLPTATSPSVISVDEKAVEKAIQLLSSTSTYCIDSPLEPFYFHLVRFIFTRSTPYTLDPSLLPSLLTSLVAARHPREAYHLLTLIPSSDLTHDHFSAVLRAPEPWKSKAYRLLLFHPSLPPSIETFHAALAGASLPVVHDYLNRLQRLGLERDLQCWNALLAATQREAPRQQWRRVWKAFRMSSFGDSEQRGPGWKWERRRGDVATASILLSSEMPTSGRRAKGLQDALNKIQTMYGAEVVENRVVQNILVKGVLKGVTSREGVDQVLDRLDDEGGKVDSKAGRKVLMKLCFHRLAQLGGSREERSALSKRRGHGKGR